MMVLWVESTSLFSLFILLSLYIFRNYIFVERRLQIERDVLVSVATVLPHKKHRQTFINMLHKTSWLEMMVMLALRAPVLVV
jgi:hypothetical protein